MEVNKNKHMKKQSVNNGEHSDKRELNLNYNTEENSFELDLDQTMLDKEYQHPDPYDTAAKNGDDINSDYDESNPYVGNEYDKNASLENDVDILGMHITKEESLKPSKRDREDSETPEDFRDDLDAEGYPKNDRNK